MAATGCYCEASAEFLHNAGHFVSVLNPNCIKSYARSEIIQQNTTSLMQKLLLNIATNSSLLVGHHLPLNSKT
jgi:transposase